MQDQLEQIHFKTLYKPALRKLVRHNMDISYHVNCAIAMYLSRPDIAALVELPTEPEAETTPFLAVGNEELGAPLQNETICPNCEKQHAVEYGKDAKTGEESKILAFVTCPQNSASYLVGISGKQLPIPKRRSKVEAEKRAGDHNEGV